MKYSKNTNIMFLDIDGVLNSQLFFLEKEKEKEKHENKEQWAASMMCSERIQWLNELCKECNMKVVISSSWRITRTIEELVVIFKLAGATFEIISKTGVCESRTRGVEIKQWIDKYIDEPSFYKNYVILDDDSDMLLNQANNFFHVDGYAGLTPNICYKIKNFLTK